MAKVAELYGVKVVDEPADTIPDNWTRRHCPFTGIRCDVSANRSDRAFLDPQANPRVTPEDAAAIAVEFGVEPLPLGICTVATQRRYSTQAEPWIICPKRMLDLRTAPDIPQELRDLMPIEPGTTVRCWWEVKFSAPDREAGVHFEYTFDYLLIPIRLGVDTDGESTRIAEFVGPPYILEVMTSSTRGGGLTEHMTDVLLRREQRALVPPLVDSRYTPNYRQVFGRMISQFFTKSEVAEAWGGQAVWLVQDQLVHYIEETTAFKATQFEDEPDGNVAMVVYGLDNRDERYELEYLHTLRGKTRYKGSAPFFSSMVGLGYSPSVELLYETLGRGQRRGRPSTNFRDFVW